ncbi:hypothetical protein H4S02_006483 [Coemansia sp. RSA 2611]|nr:hypothetical protein LPJ70_003948 [Coemansia sp. RSA 2708]KAJ2362316.1 hypothetical protein H4S01_004840 [Coemansia sp. RSA 2610]KAJ2380866.1 hypothetical protein H4S02_006483 [Coemansia sp. RSA 2611]
MHNLFVCPEAFLSDEQKPVTEDDVGFHFISYVPVGGWLHELDRLKSGPVDHGVTSSWLSNVGKVIQQQMSEYSPRKIQFNLLVVIGDWYKILGEKITIVDANITKLMRQLEARQLDN